MRELQNQREYAAGLIEALGEDATATDFMKTAKDEGEAADLWRKITIAAAIMAGGATIWLSTKSVEASTAKVISHASISLTLILVVVYLGRQASEHRAQQRRARTLGLQLASVGPFLVGLDPIDRAEVRKLLADRFFTADQHHGGQPKSGKGEGYPTTQELVKIIIDSAVSRGK
jgi:hypothetical protein